MTIKPVDGRRIGMLTPSSNTVLEPYTAAMLAPFGDEASAHFGRLRVVEISMSEASQSQFTLEPILGSCQTDSNRSHQGQQAVPYAAPS
jgi:maleate isomerase